MITEENLRLIRHGKHPLAPWSLLQRLGVAGSHKRAIWIPVLTHLSKDRADAWFTQHQQPSLTTRNNFLL